MLTLSRDLRGRRGGECGESLVEFAFASVLFLSMVLGAIEFGIAVWNYNLVSDLAQEGARFAAVRGQTSGTACSGMALPCSASNGDVQAFVQSRAAGLSVTVTTPSGAPGTIVAGNIVEVRVAHTLTVGGGVIPFWNFPIASTARMIVAR